LSRPGAGKRKGGGGTGDKEKGERGDGVHKRDGRNGVAGLAGFRRGGGLGRRKGAREAEKRRERMAKIDELMGQAWGITMGHGNWARARGDRTKEKGAGEAIAARRAKG